MANVTRILENLQSRGVAMWEGAFQHQATDAMNSIETFVETVCLNKTGIAAVFHQV
jgi:hypothetical protein